MKTLIITTLILLLQLSPAWSATEGDQRRQLAEELLSLNNVKAQVDQMFEQMSQAMLMQVQALEIPPEEQEKLADLEKTVLDILYQSLHWESMKEEYIGLYASTFTQEELQEIIAFTKSPVGRKLTEKTPDLIQQSMEIGQQRARIMMPKIQSAIEKFVGENLSD